MIWLLRACFALIAASMVMIVAATVGMFVSPGAHGLPVVLTGTISFGLTFIIALFATKNFEP